MRSVISSERLIELSKKRKEDFSTYMGALERATHHMASKLSSAQKKVIGLSKIRAEIKEKVSCRKSKVNLKCFLISPTVAHV